jgi:hypothetical protein
MKKYRIKQIGPQQFTTQVRSWGFWCTLIWDYRIEEPKAFSTYQDARDAIIIRRSEAFNKKHVYPRYFDV